MSLLQPQSQLRSVSLLSLLFIACLFGVGLCVSGWYISALYVWLPAVMALGFAFAWPFIFPCIFYGFRQKKPVFTTISIALALLGLPPALHTYSIGKEAPLPVSPAPGHLRIMQWNAQEFQGNYVHDTTMKKRRKKAIAFLNAYKPHIVCIQDYAETTGPYHTSNLKILSDTLGLPHQHLIYHSSSLFPYAKIQQGIGIFSSIPFIRKGHLPYPGRIFPEHIVWADVLWNNKPLRIVSTHFRSINLNSHNTFNPIGIPLFQRQDSALIVNPSRIKKLKFYQKEHAEQAAFLRAFLDTCSVPVILAADLNTIPASHTYRTVKGSLADGYLGTATGLGATYNYLAPQLRIDYIFHNKALRKHHFHHYKDGFFDHDHLLADFDWR